MDFINQQFECFRSLVEKNNYTVNEEQARKYIQEMEELYEGVKDYNKKWQEYIYLKELWISYMQHN